MEKNEKSKLILTVIFFVLVIGGYWSYISAEGKKRDDPTIGERFHMETSLTWLRALKGVISTRPAKPMPYKKYPKAEIIALPKPNYRGMLVEEAIAKRRSVREYSSKPLTLAQLSQLLFAAQGITGEAFGQNFRAAPSAGALYPFEVYIVANNVGSLSPGIYHYAVTDHALELLKEGDFRDRISNAALRQEAPRDAAVTFVLSAVFNRTRYKYGERAFRYIYIEAGHISQNIYLQAVSLGLGSVVAGAFLDEKVNQLIGVDGVNEAAIYLHAVGNL